MPTSTTSRRAPSSAGDSTCVRRRSLFEGFLIDGRTYLYYGPLLAVVRVPVALFGDLMFGRLTRLSMLAGYVVWCTAAFRLLQAAHPQRWEGSRASARWRTGIFMAAVAASPMLFLASWVSVYHETEMWAAAFVLATVVAAIVWTRQPTPRRGVIAAAWAAAALLTRFPVGVGAAAAVAVAAVVVARRRPRAVVPAAGIVVAAVATHMTLNVARFGSLLHLPADRQVLTLDDPERAAWFAGNGNSFFGLRFLPTTLAHYVRPDTVAFERLVPFIRFGRPAVDYADYPLETTQPAASLTATATALVVLAVIGLVFIIRRRQWLWLALTGAAAVGAVPTLMIGFIANRYLADLLPALVYPPPSRPGLSRSRRRTGRVPPWRRRPGRCCCGDCGATWPWRCGVRTSRRPGSPSCATGSTVPCSAATRPPWCRSAPRRPSAATASWAWHRAVPACTSPSRATGCHSSGHPGNGSCAAPWTAPPTGDAPLASGPGWTLRLAGGGDGTARVDFADADGARPARRWRSPAHVPRC